MASIKKLFVIFLVLAVLITIMIPVLADEDDEPEKRETTLNNAGFHCGAAGGNGRVKPAGYLNGQIVTFERIDATTWKMVGNAYVCPVCGSSDWISFSNQSGYPDGKNIQLNHANSVTPPPVFVPLNLLVGKEHSHDLSSDFNISVYEANGGLKGDLVARLRVGGSGENWYYINEGESGVHRWVVINLYDGSYIVEESGHMTSSDGLPLNESESVQTYTVSLQHGSGTSPLPQPIGGVSSYHEAAVLKNIYSGGGPQLPQTGDVTITVEKKLSEGIEDNATEFTFRLILLVNGNLYDAVEPTEKSINADETATWGPYTFPAGATVEYEVVEVDTPGFKLEEKDIKIGDSPADESPILIRDGDDIIIKYTITNTFDDEPPPQPDDTLTLALFKSFRLGGIATSVPANVTFHFELTDSDGTVAARGTYTTTGNEAAGEATNIFVSLASVSGYEFDLEQTYTLREVSGTAGGWTYDRSIYSVGYRQDTIEDELYRELYHIVEGGTPENNNEDGNWQNYFEDNRGYGPVFVNRYTRSRTGGGTTTRDQSSDTEITDVFTPAEAFTEIPEETPEITPEDIPEDILDRGPEEVFGHIVILEEEVPGSRMPKTGVTDDAVMVWQYGLCASVTGLCIMGLIIESERKKRRTYD